MTKQTETRRNFLKNIGLSAVYAGTLILSPRCSIKPAKPNIILIMADDFGFECLGCNGGRSYKTPELDKMSAEGVRFTACHSTPLCTPSRVQLMTGKYNSRNYTEFGTLPAGEKTFAHLLKNAGYHTCIAGKWQLVGSYPGSNYRGSGTYPKNAGFDEYCLWQIDKLGSRYWNPLLNINGNEQENIENKYAPDIFVDFINKFVNKHQNEPFFVYYPMVLTHSPFLPTPDSNPAAGKKDAPDKIHFADMVAYVDKLVGKIKDNLDQNGLLENTLILFVGDNGNPRGIKSLLGEQIISGGKGFTTGNGTHVPFIANWKGKTPAGRVCDDLIDFSDFLKTLTDAAGVNLPENFITDGQSFLPQILGKPGNPRDWIFCHYDPKWGKWTQKRFLFNHRWKLYQNGNFFDLQADPLEKNPLELSQLSGEAEEIYKQFKNVLDNLSENGI